MNYDRYAELRDERGLNDYKVSQALGFSPSTLSDWKAGRYTPKVDKLKAIAELFEISLEELL